MANVVDSCGQILVTCWLMMNCDDLCFSLEGLMRFDVGWLYSLSYNGFCLLHYWYWLVGQLWGILADKTGKAITMIIVNDQKQGWPYKKMDEHYGVAPVWSLQNVFKTCIMARRTLSLIPFIG